MQRLPDEIVENILLRLPVKNLLQIKCVCKLWNTMISSPQFAKLQLQQSLSSQGNNNGNNNFKILVLPEYMQPISLDFENCDDNQFRETKLDFPFGNEQSIVTLGCCDGMFCSDCGGDIVVWNPSIRQYRKLPRVNIWPGSASYTLSGFGFDSVADDYKVFKVFRESDKLVLDVFSLKTNYWRRIEYLSSVSLYHQSRNFLNGSLHWSDDSNYPDTTCFFAFGLASEKFVEIPMPDVPGLRFPEMVVFDGCLCVYCNNNVSSEFDIWIMKEYMVKDSWTKLGTVLRDTIPILDGFLTPLCYARDGDILLEIDDKFVVKYNMKERSCTTVFSVLYEFILYEYNACFEALSYVESLVSPNHDDSERPIVDGVLKRKRKRKA